MLIIMIITIIKIIYIYICVCVCVCVCVYNKQKLQILEALHIRNIQTNFQTIAIVLECLLLLTLFRETNSKSKRYSI